MKKYTITEKEGFREIVAKEGHVITTYKEGDTRAHFFKKAALPLDADLEKYNTIPEEEAKAIAADLEAKKEAEREARKAEREAERAARKAAKESAE